MNGLVKIVEKDITGLLGEKVTICILQLKSPFLDECGVTLVEGNNVLSWKPNELEKRKRRIMSLLETIKRYRKDVNIIVLPEYAIHYNMINDLKGFANCNRTVVISTYYDDRHFVDGKINECCRKNVLSVILPDNKSIENITKLEKTSFEADFVSDLPEEKMKIAKFCWSVGEVDKLYFQVFVCSDFLEHFDKVDREKGGIVIVPMCSPEIEEFHALSQFCIRPHRKWKTERCIFLCNSITLPDQKADVRMGGCSEVLGPYRRSLPQLEKDVEGGIIATVKATNIITKPSAIPSRFNVVIENPVSFILNEKIGKWKIEEKALVSKRWVINPKAFTSLGLGTYLTFARMKSYYYYRPALSKSFTKCTGIQGRDDIVAECLAEEESDALMFLFGGRSDIAASLEERTYFHVERSKGYIKYKGFPISPEPLPASVTKEVIKHREDLYRLAVGISGDQVDESLVKKMIDLKLVLGEEALFDIKDARGKKYAEYLIGVFLPIRSHAGVKESCEFFESEIVCKDLIKNPKVKDVMYSVGGGAGKEHISLHYIIRAVADHWSVKDLVLEHIQEPLSEEGIECGTRIMPLVDYLSNLEYEALLNTPIHLPGIRRAIREITNATAHKIGRDAILIRRLPQTDIEKMIEIYNSRKALAKALGLDQILIEDKIAKLFRGLIGKKKLDKNFDAIFEDIKDLYLSLSTRCEEILYNNLDNKQREIGRGNFLREISKHVRKHIEITEDSGLGTYLMATSIWNSKRRDDYIVDENYAKQVKQLQSQRIDKIRNYFSHKKGKFMRDPDYLERDIDNALDTLLSLIEFVVAFA